MIADDTNDVEDLASLTYVNSPARSYFSTAGIREK